MLRWKSRRGMKELDVMFEAFFSLQAEQIKSGEWPQLEGFLEQEDDLLFDWVSGRNVPADADTLTLIEALKHAV